MGDVRMAKRKTEASVSDLISQTEAAELRGVTRSAITDLIERGRLRAVNVAGRRLVYRSEVASFVEMKRGPKGLRRKGGK